jgi:DNA repair protein RadA/Sms
MGIVAAIVSSFRNQPVDTGVFTFGEIGLSGELRAISQSEVRIKEAAKLGFKKGIVPASNASIREIQDIDITGVKNVEEAIEILLF